MPEARRLAAVAVAVTALVADGLLLRGQMVAEQVGVLQAVWTDAMFFTDLTNLLVACVFAWVALTGGRERRPWLLGLALTCITLVFVGAQGWRLFARPVSGATLAHAWVPLLVVLYCLLLTGKGRLRWRFVPQWVAVLLGYMAYAIGRGYATGRFAYPWFDPAKVKVSGMLWAVALYVGIFVAVAVLLVLVDTLWARWGGRREEPAGTW